MKTNVQNISKSDIAKVGTIGADSGSRVRLIFGTSDLFKNDAFIKELGRLPKDVTVIGCSTAGEILGSEVHDNSVSIADLTFENTNLRSAQVQISNPGGSKDVGRKIGETLNASNLKGVLILSDGLNVNGSLLLEGLNSVLSPDVVITGGLAADGSDFKRTWVLVDRTPQSGFVTAIGFYGDSIQMRHGSQGGWDIFGPERLITKAENNVLYEIDDQPALELYKKYLGAKAAELPASALLFPIKIWEPGHETNGVVRTILGVNDKDQSMTFAGNIPVGHSAQLMRANFDRLIDGAAGAAVSMQADQPGFSLAISCVGRKLLLGSRVEEEVSAVVERLPKGASQIGFYSYGEISPLTRGGHCHLHNQTMTLTYFSETVNRKNVA